MSKQHIEKLITDAIHHLQSSGQLATNISPSFQVDATKDKQHGDFATNIALILAKPMGQKPREVAELIMQTLKASPHIKKIEIAGPGFINFFLAPEALYSVINEILEEGVRYGCSDIGKQQKIMVEFVSSNPTGPLHVGHGRHGAYGMVVADLLEAVGFNVHREYYVNDAGRQMDILATSTWLRYLLLCNEKIPFPSNAYRGEYVIDIARDILAKFEKKFICKSEEIIQNLPPDEPQGGDKEVYIDAMIARAKKLLGKENYYHIFDITLDKILTDIRDDLAEFGVHFQEWFSERAFTQTDAVDHVMQLLQNKGYTYERDGALWFRSTDLGDDKDRVLKRANGTATYFLNDLAYHVQKFTRGFDKSVDIFGSDHHGYIPRMKAGLKACGIAPEKLTYLLVQFVTLYRGGKQVQMSTRSGSFVTLRELREEVGNDAARYFYVMRRAEQHIDFDLDLAKSQSNENPMYYVQYAHARVCSVFRQLAEKQLSYAQLAGLQNTSLLKEEQELKLLSTLSRYRDMLVSAALQHEPHIVTNYLRDLATDFHAYYNSHQFLVEQDDLRHARLALITAARQVLANGLKLLGVSAPENM